MKELIAILKLIECEATNTLILDESLLEGAKQDISDFLELAVLISKADKDENGDVSLGGDISKWMCEQDTAIVDDAMTFITHKDHLKRAEYECGFRTYY
jgi:hypothetical protein